MHKRLHQEGALRVLQDHRPAVFAFLHAYLSVDEILRYLDAPDELDHSATNGSHSYKLERRPDGSLGPHVLAGNGKHTVLSRLDGGLTEFADFLREGRPDVAAMLLAKACHWAIDSHTPPHIEHKWSDKAHSKIEDDLDAFLGDGYGAIADWTAPPIRDAYKDTRASLFQAFGAYGGLMGLYESGKRASDEQLLMVLSTDLRHLNRVLAHAEGIVAKAGHA